MRTTVIPLLFGLLLLAASVGCVLWEDNQRLSGELTEQRETLEREREEHRLRVAALEANAKKREEIHGQYQRRDTLVREALGQEPLADTPLSDMLRLRIQGDTATHAAGGH